MRLLEFEESQHSHAVARYGRIGGVHCSENPKLLQGILRNEWGFDGIVMSDWYAAPFVHLLLPHIHRARRYGTYSVDQAINAGMDLEMPGPPRWRTSVLVMHMLSSQKTSDAALDACVTRLLEFVQRQARRNPDVVYGDGVERTLDTPERRAFCRKLAAEGMVVLKNDGAVLPIKGGGGRKVKVALIGPNMKERVISGGGSAALKPSYVVTPHDGLVSNAPEGVAFEYEVGTYGM